jgi:hypothetical protein
VIVNDLDVEGIGSDPSKADPPLIVDADAVLSDTIGRKFLQTVCWRNPEVGEARSSVQHDKFAKCDAKEIGRELAGQKGTFTLAGPASRDATKSRDIPSRRRWPVSRGRGYESGRTRERDRSGRLRH